MSHDSKIIQLEKFWEIGSLKGQTDTPDNSYFEILMVAGVKNGHDPKPFKVVLGQQSGE